MLDDYREHVCPKCWNSHTPADTSVATSPCHKCGTPAVRKVTAPVRIDPQGIFKCGGKDTLSVWEEIKHRPRSGGF